MKKSFITSRPGSGRDVRNLLLALEAIFYPSELFCAILEDGHIWEILVLHVF